MPQYMNGILVMFLFHVVHDFWGSDIWNTTKLYILQ